MKKKSFNKKKGILFWITGLSGSGKTTIGRKIKKEIIKIYGPTIHVSGDDLRKIFKINKYDYKSRLKYGRKCCNFAKFITDQKINLIFSIIGMRQSLRDWPPVIFVFEYFFINLAFKSWKNWTYF